MVIDMNVDKKSKCPHCGAKFDPMGDDADDDSEINYFSIKYADGTITYREIRHCGKCGQKFYTLDVYKCKKFKVSKTKMW